jgi:secondary thiamine-phosphate synthase enzyme
MWFQTKVTLKNYVRGFHIITDHILINAPEIKEISYGLLNLFIQHTSASISINENSDPTVREDLESHFNKLIPENQIHYKHTLEGPDDIPAHIKSSIFGSSLCIPIKNGKLALGTWQGIYLCEHRNYGGKRSILITINGN